MASSNDNYNVYSVNLNGKTVDPTVGLHMGGTVVLQLKQRFQRKYLNHEGLQTLTYDYYISPAFRAFFHVPLDLILYPKPYLWNKFRSFNFDLHLSNILSEKIALLAIDLVKPDYMFGLKGFHIEADVEIITVDVVDEIEEVITVDVVDETLLLSLNDDSKKVRSGASESAILKIKNARFDGGDAKELSELGTCMVCLDEFFGGKVIIKMPCSHVFHESCILRWLEERNVCPICRCEVDD